MLRGIQFLIVAGAIVCSVATYSWGRTVALVYDDSSSMAKGIKFQYANYAAQTLVSLLRDTDSFVATLTGDGKTDAVRNNVSLSAIRKQWGMERGTYYYSVENAMEYLRRNKQASSLLDDVAEDWLIVMTDGDFFIGDNKRILEEPAIVSRIQKDIRRFFDSTGTRVRVAFVLFGEANDVLPRMWAAEAPRRVEILKVRDVRDLSSTMHSIAAKIAGRDRQNIRFYVNDQGLEFNSPFPVRRITILQQGKADKLVRIASVTPSVPLANEIEIKQFEPTSPNRKLHGRISHAQSPEGQILPPGTYTISLDRRQVPQDLRILLETAVEMSVRVEDKHGNVLPTSQDAPLKLCQGDMVTTHVSFVSSSTGQPIHLNNINTKSLKVSAWLDPKNKQMLAHRSVATGVELESVQFVLKAGRNVLSAEAGYAGYFHIKRNITVIEGRTDCEGAVGVSGKWEASVPYTTSESMAGIPRKFKAVVVSDNPQHQLAKGQDRITASGIPEGVQIDIVAKGATHSLTQDMPTVVVPRLMHKDQLVVRIARNKDFVLTDPVTIPIELEPLGGGYTWNDGMELTLKPTQRNIVVQPSGEGWGAMVTDIPNAEPLKVTLLDNGRPLSVEELDEWKLVADSEENLSFEASREEGEAAFKVYPSPAFWGPCFTCVGPIQVSLHAVRKGGLESASRDIIFQVSERSWWDSCWPFLLKILLLLLLALYLFGLIIKPRFKSGSRVEYTLKDPYGGTPESSPVYLSTNWFQRYFIPFLAEKRTVEGMRFKASRSSHYIYVYCRSIVMSADVERDESPGMIDGEPITESKINWERLDSNIYLTYSVGPVVEQYEYRV